MKDNPKKTNPSNSVYELFENVSDKVTLDNEAIKEIPLKLTETQKKIIDSIKWDQIIGNKEYSDIVDKKLKEAQFTDLEEMVLFNNYVYLNN